MWFSGPLQARSHSSAVQRRLPLDLQSYSAFSKGTLTSGLPPFWFSHSKRSM